jgi:UDP-N-acetylmuramate--alanine ligase
VSISYGENPESDLHIDQVELGAKGSRARALWQGKSIGHLELNVPGRHNIDNAAAALAVGLHLGLPTAGLLAGLASFAGTGRRFELKGTVHGIRVIDDYGHHPTEIRALKHLCLSSHLPYRWQMMSLCLKCMRQVKNQFQV